MWVARCSIPLGQVGRDQPFLSASASVSLLVILTRERGAIHRHPNSFLSFYHPPTHTHTHTHTHTQQRLHLTLHFSGQADLRMARYRGCPRQESNSGDLVCTEDSL